MNDKADRLCTHVRICLCSLSQVGMYHDPHVEDAASANENRMIFTESMPRRVGSFYRGEVEQDSQDDKMCVV